MKKSIALLIVAVTVALAVPAFAELQNVVVGGQVRIRGNWFDYDSGANSYTGIEQATRINFRADFTDNVSAFIELDSYGEWGDAGTFRSNYLNGVDSKPNDNVNVYQAYIEAKEMFGTALKVRAGRQELKFGSGWILGNGDAAPYFYGLSFDALRLTYATDQFSVDGFAAKLADNSPKFEDGDIDLYGVYGSYLGIENVTLDAYWVFVRDAVNGSPNAKMTAFTGAGSIDTHTFGLRGAGTIGAFDFEAEAAYQLVDWDGAKSDADFFAGNAEVGYTFDMNWTPRVFIGGAFLEGSLDTTESDSGAFNRLFSDWRYSKILDGVDGVSLTNIWTAAVGASASPTESVKLQLSGAYLATVEEFGAADDEIGWEVDASAVYNYTQDLAFKAGYSHLFADNNVALVSGFIDGAVTQLDDVNYFYVETKLSF